MKYLLLIICTLLAPRLHAQGVQFEELPLADALRQAGEQGKLVFVDCYTVWCGPCKQMANVEFPKPEAGQYFNARFVNVKFDMERGEGLEVASRYAVNIYPTFLILSPDGGEVNRVIGSAPLGDFIEKVAAAIDSRNDLPTLTAEYATGDMTPERMKDFILVLRGAYRDSLAAVVTNDLMRRFPDDEKRWATYWPLFRDQNIVPITSPHFLFLLDNIPAFEQAAGKEEVARRLKGFRQLDDYLAASLAYRDGNRDKRFLLDYAHLLFFSPGKSREIANELFHSLAPRERADTAYWPLFHLLAFNEWGMERFDYLLAHKKDFYRTTGPARVDQTIHYGYIHKFMMVIKGYDKSATDADFDRMAREVKRYRVPGIAPLVEMTRTYCHRDASSLLDACRDAFPLFDDNLALNIAAPLVDFLKKNLPDDRRVEFQQLLAALAVRMKTDTVKNLLNRLNA